MTLPTESSGSWPFTGEINVLMIENDDDYVSLIKTSLSHKSINIFQASTPKDAIAQLYGYDKFHAITLDTGVYNGDDPVKMVRGILLAAPGVPVIALTRKDSDILMQRMLRAGVSDYLVKEDVSLAQVYRSIKRAVFKLIEDVDGDDRFQNALNVLDQSIVMMRRNTILGSNG